MIKRNQVFTYIDDALKAYNPDVFTVSGRIYATSRFPAVSVDEIEVRPLRENVDLTHPSYRSTWEVEAYTDKSSGGRAEASKLIKVVEDAFRQIGYRMTTCTPTENIKEVTISRHIARFTRVLCEDDEI